jgi:predicted ATPase/class 3 adenylate cyclase
MPGQTRWLVPHTILYHHARNRRRGHLRAASMFVDISGFTQLTETLMQHARDGAEVLTEVLNSIFHPIVQEVYDHGGFISTFAGDAFTALFPLRQPEAVFHATQTAFFVSEFFARKRLVETKFGSFELGAKVGLGAGRVEWGILGQEMHAFYFRGEAIDDCAASEHHARRGEIVASQSLVGGLGGQATAVASDGGFSRLLTFDAVVLPQLRRRPRPARRALAPFVLDAVIDLSQRAEFRNVASLFLGFDEPGDEGALNTFTSQVLDLAHRYGGYFNKMDFGDKGGVMLLLFGAPTSYEDNVARAANFLLALRSEGAGVRWRAGLTFGTVYAGIMGGDERCEYTAIGDIVNLSARLAMHAEWGEIWASAEIQSILGADYDFEALGSHQFKGKGAALEVFGLLRRKEVGEKLFTSPMFGRQTEMAGLHSFLTPTIAERRFAGLIYVYGEAGMGKSRLVYEVRQALMAAHDLSWAYCPSEGVLRQSLNPIVYFLRGYFGQSKEQSEDENKARFDAILSVLIGRLPDDAQGTELGRELDRTRSMLGALVDLRWPGSLYESLEPKLRFENTLTALVSLMQAESLLHPLVIEIDDGQVLDIDTANLLQLLTREAADFPVAFIVSARYRDDGSKFTVPLDPGLPVSEIDLNYLSIDDMRAFAEQSLGAALADDVVHLLAEKTNGNPFFIEQLALDLHERNLLVPDAEGGRLMLAPAQATEVPTTITAVLVARLDRLTASIKLVVQTAAVLGREFELLVLSQMLQGDPEFRRTVQRATEQDIWSAVDEVRYIFKHALLRDSAYEMQLRARLRELHQIAGAAFEIVYARDLSSRLVDLAYHFEQAGNADKARHYLLRAGDQAKTNFQNQMALSLYERLLALLDPSDPQRAYAHEQRGDIYATIGEHDLALQQYKAALAGLSAGSGLAIDREAPGLYRKVGLVYMNKGEYAVAFEWLGRAERVSMEAGNTEMARIHTATAAVLYRQGKATEALGRCQMGLEIADHLNEATEIAYGYMLRGTIHTGLGQLDEAIADYEQSLALSRKMGDLQQLTKTDNSLGAVYYYKGDWERAIHHYRQSLEVAEKIGYVDQQATVSNNLGEIFIIQGRLAEAAAAFQSCLNTWRRTGFQVGVALSYWNLAQVAVMRHEWQAALDFLWRSLETLERLGARDWLTAEVYRLLAEVHLGLGRMDEAWAYCHQSLDIATSQDLKLIEGNARRVQGRLHREHNNWQEAEQALLTSLKLAEELGIRHEQGQALIELAHLYRVWGQADEKEAFEATVHEILGRAISIFTELDARWHLEQAQALHRQLAGAEPRL